jgi:hypothetical protein
MTRDRSAQKRPPGQGEGPEGGGDSRRQILPVWAKRGNDPSDHAPSPDRPTTSPAPASVGVTDDAPGSFDKKGLAAHVLLSVRTLDRLAAQGLLPPADLTISGSKRWLRSTISRWLAGKPKLSGRKGGRP